jgi:Matrixin
MRFFVQLALLLGLITPTLARAFTLSNSAAAAYKQDTVKVNVAAHSCDNLGVTNDQLLGIINQAVDQYWNKVPSSRLRMEAGNLSTVAAAFQTDRICNAGTDCEPNTALTVPSEILVSCNTSTDNFSSGAVLAVTVPNNIQGRTIQGALILLNDRVDNQFQNKSHDEQVAILAHEIGHALGLGHSSVSDSLMYFRSIPTRRSLGWDDIDGITYLYPTEQPFSGCGSIQGPDAGSGTWAGLLLGFAAALALANLRRPSLRKGALSA